MEDAIPSPDPRRSALLSAPDFRAELLRSLRRRVPAADAEDLVQSALADALVARTAPADAVELRKWVYGILRHKVADLHRDGRRELIAPAPETGMEGSGPEGARDLLRWAERELPPGEQAAGTFGWMLREGDGEKLETIAREERVPAPRVRQRVARLRRHLRERWALALAAASLLVLAGILVWRKIAAPGEPPPIAALPRGLEEARELRRAAFEDCDQRDYERCLEGLDAAKTLDRAGDGAAAVRDARARAAAGLAEEAAPAPAPAPSTRRAVPAPARRAAPAPGQTSTPPPPPVPTTSMVVSPPRHDARKPTKRPASSSVFTDSR